MTAPINVQPQEAEPIEASASQKTRDFRQLYLSHRTMVWRSLLRLGVAESSIEDAVQEVFITAYRRLDSFEGRSKITTWLYGIAIRVAKDQKRAQFRRDRRLDQVRETQATEPPLGQGPQEALARKEANLLLHRLLNHLPEAQRELFVLVDLEGLPLQDAAESLGLRLRSCQRHLKTARQAIEAALLEAK